MLMPVTLLGSAGDYRKGAKFGNLGWAATALAGYWPEGSKWRWKGNKFNGIVRVEDGHAVREDGQVLKPYSVHGVTYYWDEPDTEMGAILRYERWVRGLTLKEVERETGISFSYLSALENSMADPSEEVLGKLCDFYGIDREALDGPLWGE